MFNARSLSKLLVDYIGHVYNLFQGNAVTNHSVLHHVLYNLQAKTNAKHFLQ